MAGRFMAAKVKGLRGDQPVLSLERALGELLTSRRRGRSRETVRPSDSSGESRQSQLDFLHPRSGAGVYGSVDMMHLTAQKVRVRRWM